MGTRLTPPRRETTPRAPERIKTIRDVARHAGVSPATVSRVLTRSAHPVSAEGRRRVLAAARKLSYIPNLLARSLLTHETAAIGVLIPDVSNPYYAAVVRGIEDAVGPTGRTVILCNTDRQPAKQRLYLRALMERRVDGIIIAGGAFGRAEMAITGRALPVVMIGRHRAALPSVRIDNVAAGRMVTSHLVDLGHRWIAHLAGPPSSLTAADRLAGYCQALRLGGLVEDASLVVEAGFSPEATPGAIRRLFDRPDPPTAVVAANDQVAIGAIRALHDLGRRVPDDVSVTGCDDVPVASYTIPSLTTVAIPMHDLGRVAVASLVELRVGKRVGAVVLPCTLRIRESTSTHRGRR